MKADWTDLRKRIADINEIELSAVQVEEAYDHVTRLLRLTITIRPPPSPVLTFIVPIESQSNGESPG